MLGKYDDALSDANRALEIESTNLDSFILRGKTHFMLGQYNKALINFNKASEINPNNEHVLALRKILIDLKITSKSELRNTESLVNHENTNYNLHKITITELVTNVEIINTLLFRGELYYSLEQYDEALLYYNKALEVDPNNLTALFLVEKFIIHQDDIIRRS
ncbi:hypothetical protein C2G38_2096181 [Gigaspora rosea]|uniref:Uncharacterized protein n=1 Tax=Gigaspora rosea TaxID=44941 RepID=A0A397UX62_9GLOM|nr:hypothetical protein C2G38_2096181 [Gigaspora rosea]